MADKPARKHTFVEVPYGTDGKTFRALQETRLASDADCIDLLIEAMAEVNAKRREQGPSRLIAIEALSAFGQFLDALGWNALASPITDLLTALGQLDAGVVENILRPVERYKGITITEYEFRLKCCMVFELVARHEKKIGGDWATRSRKEAVKYLKARLKEKSPSPTDLKKWREQLTSGGDSLAKTTIRAAYANALGEVNELPDGHSFCAEARKLAASILAP